MKLNILMTTIWALAFTSASVAAEGGRWSSGEEDSSMVEDSADEMEETSNGSVAAGAAVNGTDNDGAGRGGGGPPLVPPVHAHLGSLGGLGGVGVNIAEHLNPPHLNPPAAAASRSTSRNRLISVGLPSCVARPVYPSRLSSKRQRDNFVKAVEGSFDKDGKLEWTNAALNGMLRYGKQGQWRKCVKEALKKEIHRREGVARKNRENHVAETRDKFIARMRKGFRLSREQAIEVWNDGGMADRIRARFEKELEEDLDDLKDLSLKAMEHCGKAMEEYNRKDNDEDGDGDGGNDGPGGGSAMGGGGILA